MFNVHPYLGPQIIQLDFFAYVSNELVKNHQLYSFVPDFLSEHLRNINTPQKIYKKKTIILRSNLLLVPVPFPQAGAETGFDLSGKAGVVWNQTQPTFRGRRGEGRWKGWVPRNRGEAGGFGFGEFFSLERLKKASPK